MRRHVGVAAAHHRKMAAERYKEVSETLASDQFNRFKELYSNFKTNLEQFAAKHRDKLKKSPELRVNFQNMCAQLGVDPLVSSKGMWTEMLGFGDFYYDLTVQIAEICTAHAPRTGGLIRLSELLQRLQKARSAAAGEVSKDDVLVAVKRLSRLGGGYTVLPLKGDNDWLIQSTPMELSLDHSDVLRFAEDRFYFTESDLINELKWDKTRADRLIANVLRDGMVWVDEQNPNEIAYWFPSLFKTESLAA